LILSSHNLRFSSAPDILSYTLIRGELVNCNAFGLPVKDLARPTGKILIFLQCYQHLFGEDTSCQARHRWLSMRCFIAALVLALFCSTLLAQDPVIHPLYKIERSKNANIIQYDARSGPDGKLLKKDPVVGYWIRLAEQGQVMELTWVQRTFAFGFKTRLAKDRESAEIDMAQDLGAPISVNRFGDEFRATAPIEGKTSFLEKIYIRASGKGISVTVEYIELHGEDVKTGETRYQKIIM
jgi:hypothetical protein